MLISGASIAGPALAFWLARYGFAVTVVEKGQQLRTGGQNIDVRGPGREVLRRMELEQVALDSGTGEVGTRFVHPDGSTLAEFPAGKGDSEGATAELEILRGQLARLLVEACGDGVDYVYGDQIVAVAQDADAVDVTFQSGDTRKFDLLIIAEGLRSSTRRLVFGDSVELRDLGQYTGYGTIPRIDSDDRWWRWCPVIRGRAVTLRPDNTGTTRATLSIMMPEQDWHRLDPEEQVEALAQEFSDAGWQAPRVIEALRADPGDFYLDRSAQVRMSRWSTGRVVLAGDAAHCASPISGMGTTLALTGAYLLAGELATHSDLGQAFAGYEKRHRPLVEKAQKLPPGAPRLANPHSRLGIWLLRTVLRAIGSSWFREMSRRVSALRKLRSP